jgi:hypothetical protein
MGRAENRYEHLSLLYASECGQTLLVCSDRPRDYEGGLYMHVKPELLASCSDERNISNSACEELLYVVGANKSRDAAGAMAQEWLHQ